MQEPGSTCGEEDLAAARVYWQFKTYPHAPLLAPRFRGKLVDYFLGITGRDTYGCTST